MALQEYVQAQKSSANTYSKLVVCSHKPPWYNQLFAICMCSLPLRDTVLLSAQCWKCSLVSITPAPKAHHIPPWFTLLSLAEPIKVNTTTHAQLRDRSAWTPLQALDEPQAREQHSLGDGTQAETPCLLCWNCRKTFPLHTVVPPSYRPVVAAVTLLVGVFVQALPGLLWVKPIRTDQPKSCKLFTINW